MIGKDIITEREAWRLFQIAAISEAVSWMLLLIGILIKYVIRPGDDTWVAIGGSIHGTVFLAYAVAVLGLYRILRLSFFQVVLAAVASVVPFGTLAYEQWLQGKRTKVERGSFRQTVVRGVIRSGTYLLAVQQPDATFWCLPGGVVLVDEAPEQSLQRTVTEQLGVSPVVGSVEYVQQYLHRGVLRIELFYSIRNIKDFEKKYPIGSQYIRTGLDAISFISPESNLEIKPQVILVK